MKCDNCHTDQAETRFTWPVTGAEPQTACLCNGCGSRWWAQYANTPSGLGLQLEPVE